MSIHAHSSRLSCAVKEMVDDSTEVETLGEFPEIDEEIESAALAFGFDDEDLEILCICGKSRRLHSCEAADAFAVEESTLVAA